MGGVITESSFLNLCCSDWIAKSRPSCPLDLAIQREQVKRCSVWIGKSSRHGLDLSIQAEQGENDAQVALLLLDWQIQQETAWIGQSRQSTI
jgi:hypothetical protein